MSRSQLIRAIGRSGRPIPERYDNSPLNTRYPPTAVSNRLNAAFAWFILAGVFGCGLYRIQFGIDYSDEGFYLAAPMRYALGDVPFRDEWSTSPRMFDLVLTPIFVFFPNISVYQLRFTWLLVQFGSMLAVYLLFKRFSSPTVVAAACGSTVWLSNIIWTPGYHLMGAFFLVLGWALWLRGCLSEGRANSLLLLGLGGGLALSLGVLSYVPLIAVLIVPALVFTGQLVTGCRRAATTLATAVFLGTFTAVSTATLLSFAYFQVFWDWIDAGRAFLAVPWYTGNPGGKLPEFVRQVSPYAVIVPAVAMIVLGMLASCRYRKFPGRLGLRGGWILVVVLAAAAGGLVLALLFRLRIPATHALTSPLCQTMPLRIVAVALGLHLGALLLIAARGFGERSGGWSLVYFSFFAGAVILALIYGVPSSHAFKMVFAVLPLMVSGVVAVHRVLRDSAADRLRRSASAVYMVALSLAVGVGSLRYQSQCNYGGFPLVGLTQEFSHPLLSGLRGERFRVSAIENVISYLSTRVRRGDFLLAYDNVALLYYLTQTRPAIDNCATAKVVPVELRRRAVQKMIDGSRVPEYAVRYISGGPWLVYSTKDAVDPVHAFVARHYDLEITFPPFEIWRQKQAGTQPRE